MALSSLSSYVMLCCGPPLLSCLRTSTVPWPLRSPSWIPCTLALGQLWSNWKQWSWWPWWGMAAGVAVLVDVGVDVIVVVVVVVAVVVAFLDVVFVLVFDIDSVPLPLPLLLLLLLGIQFKHRQGQTNHDKDKQTTTKEIIYHVCQPGLLHLKPTLFHLEPALFIDLSPVLLSQYQNKQRGCEEEFSIDGWKMA